MQPQHMTMSRGSGCFMLPNLILNPHSEFPQDYSWSHYWRVPSIEIGATLRIMFLNRRYGLKFRVLNFRIQGVGHRGQILRVFAAAPLFAPLMQNRSFTIYGLRFWRKRLPVQSVQGLGIAYPRP